MSPSTTKPMAIPAQGDLSGTPASIRASEPPQTVAIEEEPFDSRMSETHAHGVGEFRFRRKQIRERAFGQGAVADFAPARPAQEFHFADRERREIVMQHEALEGFFFEEKIQPLHVFLCAERGGGKRLRLAARKERRAVNAGQHAHFARDLANLVERAGIGTPAASQHIVAEDAFAQALERASSELSLSSSSSGIAARDFVLDGVYQAVAFRLRMLRRVRAHRAVSRRTACWICL